MHLPRQFVSQLSGAPSQPARVVVLGTRLECCRHQLGAFRPAARLLLSGCCRSRARPHRQHSRPLCPLPPACLPARSGRRGLEVLQACAQLLMREIGTESLASGLEVSVQASLPVLCFFLLAQGRKRLPWLRAGQGVRAPAWPPQVARRGGPEPVCGLQGALPPQQGGRLGLGDPCKLPCAQPPRSASCLSTPPPPHPHLHTHTHTHTSPPPCCMPLPCTPAAPPHPPCCKLPCITSHPPRALQAALRNQPPPALLRAAGPPQVALLHLQEDGPQGGAAVRGVRRARAEGDRGRRRRAVGACCCVCCCRCCSCRCLCSFSIHSARGDGGRWVPPAAVVVATVAAVAVVLPCAAAPAPCEACTARLRARKQ